ncbi:hypothetical protein [Nocardia sp. NPDC048505]|uniref:hypothetical protein n=1 Tax=unclassified Nocardia TaxID=2637762 RepID=UPI00340D0151
MTERIEFPDVEKALVDFLTTKLGAASDTAKVATKVPEPRPARMVRVTRDDRRPRLEGDDSEVRRGARLIVDRARIALECSDDAGNGAALAATVRTLVNTAAPGYIGTMWCDYVEDAGIENSTDPATASPRYVIVIDLIVRGKVLD